MKGYKGFGRGLTCRGKQYAENAVFEEETAEICKSGMHFCKNPLDVLEYYPLVDESGNMSEFAEIEALDEAKTDDDRKYCTKKLKVGAKISFAKLVQASIELESEKTTVSKLTSDEKKARIGSSGDWAQIGSSGNWAHEEKKKREKKKRKKMAEGNLSFLPLFLPFFFVSVYTCYDRSYFCSNILFDVFWFM